MNIFSKIRFYHQKYQMVVFSTAILISLGVAPRMFAALDNTSNNTSGQLRPPLRNIRTLEEFILKVLDVAITIGAIVIVVALVYAGFLFVTAQGSEDGLKTAKTAFKWSVIGGAILLGAKALALGIAATIKSL